jgi:hydroxyethylthiazole kinase-like uncharacterized protein yjeF
MNKPIKITAGLISNFLNCLKRKPHEHKGYSGKVLLVGGDKGKSGALLLAGKAALYGGAGWTILSMFDKASTHVVDKQPELMINYEGDFDDTDPFDEMNPDVIAIGPGLGLGSKATKWVKQSLLSNKPIILDADALTIVAKNGELLSILQNRDAESIITPHPGEAASLLGLDSKIIQEDRIKAINLLINLTSSIVVLKGMGTLIGSKKNPIHQCVHGNPGMATGGMGDVLTGFIAAIVAQGVRHHLNMWESTLLSVQLHAMASDSLKEEGIGPIGMTPSELIQTIRKSLNAPA